MPQPLPSNVEWLLVNRGDGLRAVLAAQHVNMTPETALRTMMQADPSPGHHATQWLCDTLIAGGMRWEDLAGGAQSKAAETLKWFSQHRRSLDKDQRNLVSYISLGSLYHAVHPYLEPHLEAVQGSASDAVSGKEVKRQASLAARRDSTVVCNHDDLIVAIPHTMQAAQWWGRGTRWCTAADKDNFFEHYNEVAPLVVIVLPHMESREPGQHKGKLQLCISPAGEFQFMDAADQDVDRDFIARHWETLGPIMLWAAQRTPQFYMMLPHRVEGQNIDMCTQAVAYEGDLLDRVPREFVDEELCVLAVGKSGRALQMVPQELRTPRVCLAAVENNGFALHYVPSALRTPQLCLLAVSRQGNAINYVPQGCRTRQVCLAALKAGAHISEIPTQYHDNEIIQAALRGLARNLSMMSTPSIPGQTAQHCKIAVAAHGEALQYVEPRYIDADLCMLAVRQNGLALGFVPHSLRSPQIYRAAVKQDGYALNYVPAEQRTPNLYHLALKTHGAAIRGFPRHLRNARTDLAAVQNDPGLIELCDIEHTEANICAAIIGEPELCGHDYVTQDMIISCVDKNWKLLAWVAIENITPEMCTVAVQQSKDALELVPRQFMTAVSAAIPELDPADIAMCQPWQPEVALAGLAQRLQARHDGWRPEQDGPDCSDGELVPGFYDC